MRLGGSPATPTGRWARFVACAIPPLAGRCGPLVALEVEGSPALAFPGPDPPGALGPAWPWPAGVAAFAAARGLRAMRGLLLAHPAGWVLALPDGHGAAYAWGPCGDPPAPADLGLPGPWLDASEDPRVRIGALAAAGRAPELREAWPILAAGLPARAGHWPEGWSARPDGPPGSAEALAVASLDWRPGRAGDRAAILVGGLLRAATDA